MRHPAPPSAAKVAHVMELIAPGACFWSTLGHSPAEIAYTLLGLLGLAVIAYVAVPVLKTLGKSWSAKIEARLLPRQRRGRRDRARNRRRT